MDDYEDIGIVVHKNKGLQDSERIIGLNSKKPGNASVNTPVLKINLRPEDQGMKFGQNTGPFVNPEIKAGSHNKSNTEHKNPPPRLLNKSPDKPAQNAEPSKKPILPFGNVPNYETSQSKDSKILENNPKPFNPTPSLGNVKFPIFPNVTPPNLDSYKLPIYNPPNPPTQSRDFLLNQHSKKIEDNLIKATQGIRPNSEPINSKAIIKLDLNYFNIPRDNIPINITKNTESALKTKLKTVYEILTNYLDYEKINEDDLLSKFEKFQFEPQEKDNLIKFISNQISCSKCKEKNIRLKKFKCLHAYCENCLKIKLYDSWNNIKLGCSECNKLFDISEESKIYEFCGVNKIEFEYNGRANKLQKDKGELVCNICEKPKKNYSNDSCLHTCLECQASLIRNKIVECPICSNPWDLNEIESYTFQCKGCSINTPFIQGFGKYLHQENCLMCSQCSYTSLVNEKCKVCSISLKKKEKFELNDHFFTFCAVCKTEQFRGDLSRSDCCQQNFCNECSSQPCPLCLKN